MNNIEMNRMAEILQREFGPDWLSMVQELGTENLRTRVGKELTSFMAFPERGEGGKNNYRGNCSPKVVEAVLKYVLDSKRYYRKDISHFKLLDIMSGSGTSGDVADKYGIDASLYDLNPNPRRGIGGWNALKDDIEESADLAFWHPPYDQIIRYSYKVWSNKPHPDDLSECESYSDFVEKMNFVLRKLYTSLRNDGRLAILVGDIRERDRGGFHSMQKDLMRMGKFESFIVKGQYNCVSDTRTYRKPFIPVVTEYMLIYHKESPIMVPYTYTKESIFDMRKHDYSGLTWFHLIRSVMEELGGSCSLQRLYLELESHPKSKKNENWKARVRATIYEKPNDFVRESEGTYRLSYAV